MNRLTSFQRKIAYAICIVVLVVPIFVLGMPASGEDDSGGLLARLRQKHDLGETTIGDVDPTSATMNLVLLGLRGVATNLLWMEHEEQKRTKQWAQMRSTTDSIIMLQPHFLQVWRFHGWDLAYNVSAEWDAVEDRYYWVKQGAKFNIRGTKRNKLYPELYWGVGRILGHKIGRSDEWRFFRKFFRSDPNETEYTAGPDPDINPSGQDNYLAARTWFQQANDVEDGTFDGKQRVQHLMMRALFRSYPARSLLDYAEVFLREGLFDEVPREAWRVAFNEWTQKYGQEVFQTPDCEVFMEVRNAEVFPEDFNRLKNLERNLGVDDDTLKEWVFKTQNVTNYRYWRLRAIAESEANTMAAHRHFHRGEELFKESNLTEALKELGMGMSTFEMMLNKYPSFLAEDNMIEEGLMGILLFQKIHELLNKPLPDPYPLKALWDAQQSRVPYVEDLLNRRLE